MYGCNIEELLVDTVFRFPDKPFGYGFETSTSFSLPPHPLRRAVRYFFLPAPPTPCQPCDAGLETGLPSPVPPPGPGLPSPAPPAALGWRCAAERRPQAGGSSWNSPPFVPSEYSAGICQYSQSRRQKILFQIQARSKAAEDFNTNYKIFEKQKEGKLRFHVDNPIVETRMSYVCRSV